VEVSQEPRDEKGRNAKGKEESYFWLLSRKSNLRSLTPKELQMHGRQHTGVSIYEARTERTPLPPLPRRKMREAAGVTKRDGSRNGKWRDEDKTERWIRERKRGEGRKERVSTRESSTTIGTVFRVSHPSSPCQNPYFPPPDADPLLES